MNSDYIFTELGKFHIPEWVDEYIKKKNITKLRISYNCEGRPLYSNQRYTKYIKQLVTQNGGSFEYKDHSLMFSIPITNSTLLDEFKELYIDQDESYWNFSFFTYSVEVNGYHYKNIEKWMVDNYNRNQSFLKFGYDYQKATFTKKLPSYDEIGKFSIYDEKNKLPSYNELFNEKY